MTATSGRSVAARLALRLISVYQTYVSPILPPSCRYLPTCSEYAVDAVSRYGALRGSWLALRRFARCGPWHRGGFDPVPHPPKHEPAAGRHPHSAFVSSNTYTLELHP